MNDRDLKSILKTVPVPERDAEYWDDFPSRVRVQLRPAVQPAPRPLIWPRLAWAGGLACVGLFLFLTILPVHFFLKNEKTFRRQMAELPRQLQTFMADEHGMHYLIAEKE